MEARLKSLCAGNSPESRREWALGAKSQGRKVIGTLCSYVPEEVIYAAGMLPWRVTGTWDSDLSRALVYRDADMCKYCSHVLEALLRGELHFLDGVVASDWDDDRRRLYDLWSYTDRPPFSAILSAPRAKSELSQRYFAQELRKLALTLRDAGGVEVTNQSLWQAIEVYDHMRDLIHRVYETRKLPVPPLSGAEVLGITTAAMVMDPAHFNRELAALLPYIEGRDSGLGAGHPRILVSSDMLDNPAYLGLVEGEGCSVAMDDLDTGSRHFWRRAAVNTDDPFMVLAAGYCLGPACPPAFNWKEQGGQILRWVRAYGVDGVIELSDEFSPGRQWRAPILRQQLAGAGVPHLQTSRGYALEATGSLRTRVGAFLEMIDQDGD
jgi:benzoyl-CoA reductase/2-hydroxyglutaryl-CoA dehydratase subunit BcrC/BadD/HgdB